MRILPLAALLVVAAGCTARSNRPSPAPGPAAAPASASRAPDPVGTWDWTAAVEGDSITGTLQIIRAGAGYAGTTTQPGQPSLPLMELRRAGDTVSFAVAPPNGPVTTVRGVVSGAGYSGRWADNAGNQGSFTARRR